MINVIAPAKINLYLHVVGRRQDGYHLLDSLFAFTNIGDCISVVLAPTVSLSIDGPFASQINTPIEENLVFRAAELLQKKYQVLAGASIHLTKNIPVGSGLGGGSSDAAATLLALNTLWKLQASNSVLEEIALSLGADVPSCLYQQPVFVSGIGEIIKPLSTTFSPSPILLIKPPESLSTPLVYQKYAAERYAFSTPVKDVNVSRFTDFLALLQSAHNDLMPPAENIAPVITTILQELSAQSGCLLARMSGSGSTCFALFSDDHALALAEKKLSAFFPSYWIQKTTLFW